MERTPAECGGLCHTVGMDWYFLFVVALFFVYAAVLAFLSFKSTEGGTVSKWFAGLVALLVIAGLLTVYFVTIVPAVFE
jgi:hypothetical protein